LRVSLEENNKTNGICVYIYKYGEAYVVGTIVGSKNPYDPGYTYSMDEACLKNSSNVWVSPAVYARVSVINTTSELGQRIMQILGSNRLTARLIESGCKVNLMMAEYSFDEADRCFNAYLYHGEKEIVLDLTINLDSGRIEKISFNAPE